MLQNQNNRTRSQSTDRFITIAGALFVVILSIVGYTDWEFLLKIFRLLIWAVVGVLVLTTGAAITHAIVVLFRKKDK